MTTSRVAVIGAGNWGTALANLTAGKGIPTTLWSFEPEVAELIEREHRNHNYLTEVELDPRLRATTSLETAVRGASVVVSASPSHVVRQVMGEAARYLEPDALVVSASKGIEVGTLQMMDGVLSEVLPLGNARRTAFLSGPSFALEVARRLPTAVTMASADPRIAEEARKVFLTDFFRVYTTTDVIGAEVGGALKNVIAIASGVVTGMGYGHNTLSALITRGLAEITRLAVALGAEPLTLAGLAGVGDLILTCTGGLSRNRSVGVALGEGRSLEEIVAGMTMVAEGIRTTRSAYELAVRHGVEMPIVSEIHALLFEGRPPREAVEALMVREPKPERG
ncbi:MAG: NAD(P)-dependent glycerol-3-phosphate dehydrogenase [Gemmatimonadota bacterium]|jgi:glycerol-3-phosphate dehydrogenase (NAD(P)+)|nr:NAD(P)-dependent glycerol-3-phosphate dehydrogenase [Gemmatimonadota bacterium]